MTRSTRFSRLSSRILLTASVALAGGVHAARADLLAYDSFSGAPGQSLASTSGGTGFSDAWHAGNMGPSNVNQYVQQGTSLSGGMNAPLGGRVAALAQYSLGSGLTRDLSSSIGTPGTSVYISMLLRADGTLNEGAAGGFFGVALNAATTTAAVNNDLFIGKTSGSNFGIEDVGGNNSHLAATTAAVGVTDSLVVRADFLTSGVDRFTLYVNPTATSMGDTVVKQDSFLGSISSLSIYSTGAFSLDELRVGTTLGDVMPAGEALAVPEPASAAMLGIGGLGMAAAARVRRSRRRPVA